MNSPADATERLRHWGAVLVAATVVAVACGLVAASGDVSGAEAWVFHAINDLPDWLEPFMFVCQLAGVLAVPLIVAAVAAWFRRWRLVVALVAFVPLKLVVEKLVVKQLVERERPATSLCGAPDEFDPECVNLRADAPVDGLAFVSGHAIITWGVATLLWPVLPARWRWIPVLVATLNAIARVYLGAHNPLDVVGGAAVGIAIGALLVLIVDPARRPPDAAPA